MKLSIITISYNNKLGLQKTINSVLSQTWDDFEWIIIDGGSNDGTKELIEATSNILEKSNSQAVLSFWCSEPDLGVYNAQNKGLSHAKGEYLNFMNAGDVFHNEFTLKEVFSNELYGDVIYGNWMRSYPSHEELRIPPDNMSLYYLYSENICHQAMFIKKECLKDGYDERFKILADEYKWLELASRGCCFQYLNSIICNFEAVNGLSETQFARIAEEKQMIEDSLSPLFAESLKLHKQKHDELLNIGDKLRFLLKFKNNHILLRKYINICMSLPYLLIKIILRYDK